MMSTEDTKHDARPDASEALATDPRERTSARTERTCVGCGEKDAPSAFVRLVLAPAASKDASGSVVVDAARGSFGRGAYVHPSPACAQKAARGGLARAFKTKIDVKGEELALEIAAALERRVEGLLLAAHRAREVALGTDAALEALAQGAPCVVVATDAGSIAASAEVTAAVTKGRAAGWGSKERLGALLGRGNDVALVAVTRAQIAEEILRACRGASACRVTLRQEIRDFEHVSEVR